MASTIKKKLEGIKKLEAIKKDVRRKLKLDFDNIYEQIPNVKDMRLSYKDSDIIQLQLQKHYLVIGGTGSKKTNFILNMLKRIQGFTRIYVWAKKLDEPLYIYLRTCMAKVMKKRKDNTLYFESDDISTFPDFTNKEEAKKFNDGSNQCIIVDDMLCEKQKNLIRAMIMGRKYNFTIFYLSQSLTQTPKVIRRQCDYLVIKKQNQEDDLRKIYKEYSSSIPMTFDNFMSLYNAIKLNDNNGILLDTVHTDPKYHLRVNFVPVAEIEELKHLINKS
jgi:hypothetical protein